MKWFKHDSDASSDAKVKKLLIKYGAVGYAVYFHCIELIASDISDHNLTFELEHDSEIIADNLKINGTADKSGIDMVEEIMRYIISLGLFEQSGNRIFCSKLLNRLDSSMTSNKGFRDMILKAKGISSESHDVVMIESCKTRQDKTRQDKNKGKHPQTGLPITLSTYNEIVKRYGQDTVDDYFERVFDYCQAKGKSYKDYSSTVRNWIKKDLDEGKVNTVQSNDLYITNFGPED